MSTTQVDAATSARLARLGSRVLDGEPITRDEGHWLFEIEGTDNIFELLGWANRIREHFKGNQVHLCSIVNIKAGGCPEDCRFCAQSSAYVTESPRHGLIDEAPVLGAATEAQAKGVTAVGLVAAWRGLTEGPILDEVCHLLERLKQSGQARPDGSLGMIRHQAVADRLRDAGLVCYNHNLETSRRFFPRVCGTHTYEDRIQTIRLLQQSGIKICSGGILGMGETRADRCELAFELRELGVHIVPINILNPIAGTPFAGETPVSPMEVLKSIACFRLILPRQEITVAGGRTMNLRDLQSFIFMAGASALMVGNYLTTPNQPIEKDLQMLADLGLDPRWTRHGFSDQEQKPAQA
jgi:biotin synthase